MAAQVEKVAHRELVLGGSTILHAHNPIIGSLVQMVYYQTGALQTAVNPIIPFDNTIPQITEGAQLMSLVITPKAATNKLIITVLAVVAISGGISPFVAMGSLFWNTNVNAIAAGCLLLSDTILPSSFVLRHHMVAGIYDQPITFKFRMGFASGNHTLTFNGSNGVGEMGGVMASSMTIEEVMA